MRSADAAGGADTQVRGFYRAGAFQQSAQMRGSNTEDTAPAQELVAAGGMTYTRPADDPEWTRWPGTSFDAAYGITSPFAALRLYTVADQKLRGEAAALPGVAEPTYRVQAIISEASIRRLMDASAKALVPDAERRNTLLEQVGPLMVSQTVNYWVTEGGKIYQAVATLLTADPAGQPAPWMEITWRFWGYDDPAITVVVPQNFRDAPGPVAESRPLPTARPASAATAEATLVVRVFASAGVPADNLAVTVYPAGEARQPIDWRDQPEARFALPPGRYDVLVQTDYAQEWLRGLEVRPGVSLARDVTFDFGTLRLTVLRAGRPAAVDIVTYPAGSRQNWVDWRSDNPAEMRLRAGTYDVEIAYDDYQATQTVTGLRVKAGETTEQTINLD